MDESAVNRAKAKLDAELSEANPNVGIMFGLELFNQFRKKQWLTLETFGALGTTLFGDKLPAYSKSHYAFASWDIPEDEFRVGRNA